MPPTGTTPAAITPQGVRDGDPAVLAALAARRGPAVLAFAGEVCEPSYVVRATADAFARFRAAVADPGADMSVHPDALLLRCARRAAIELAPRGPDLGCGPAVELLVARAERTIDPRDTELLDRHLAGCAHCAGLSERLETGDRAYREAEETPLDPSTLAPMVAALAAAAPVRMPETNGAILPSTSHRGQIQDSSEEEPEPAPEEPAPEPEPAPEDTPSLAEEVPAEEPEPVADEPVAEQPVAEEPVAEEPVVEEPVAEEPVADDPVAEEPVAEEPVADDPVAEEPVAEEPDPEPSDAPTPEAPIGTRRVTGAPASYYEIPTPAPTPRRQRARRAATGAAAAGGAAASLTRRAGRAARKRLERPAAQPLPTPVPEPEAQDTRTWARVESIEFPAQPEPEPAPFVLEDDGLPLRAEPELEETAAKAAARHYRRLRHARQRESSLPADGRPPRLERPKRDRGPHLPLSAHGPRDLALPAGLLVVAVLVIMAVSGVFGGGSETPTTGTAVKAPAEVSLVTQSATSLSLADAERIAARATGITAP